MSDDEGMSEFRPKELPEGVGKEIIKEAPDESFRHPKKGDELTVHYSGSLTDGTKFDSSRDRGEPIQFTLGEGKVIKGWEAGIPTMKKGEIAKFTIQPEFAYGEAGNPPTIPASAVLVFEVELISWVARDDVFRDGGVVKSTTQEGSGYETPKTGDEVLCHMKVLMDGKVFEEKMAWETIVGSCTLEPESYRRVVDKVLSDMKLNEKCSLECSKNYIFPDKGECTIELHLEAIYETTDSSHLQDASVMKKKVFAPDGEYAKPADDVRCTLRVEAVTDGASPIAGFSGSKEISFTTGSGEACDALDCVAVAMCKGERAIVTCNAPTKCSDKLLGLGDLKVEKLVFTIEMVDFKSNKEIHAMGGEEKVLLGLKRKEKGGDLFKNKRFELALMKYKKVTELMGQNDGMSKECKQRAGDLKHIAEMNKVACYLQLGDPTAALAICNTILHADRNNTKALLRRAKAHFSRHEHVDALKDLERVIELEPENAEAKGLVPKVKQAQKVLDKETSNAYAKMMGGLSKCGFGKENKKPDPPPRKPEPVDEQSKDIVAVTFKLEHKIEMGEKLFVIGKPEALGGGDVTKGLQLKRAPAPPDYEAMALGKAPKEVHLWEALIDIPVSEGKTEYQYLVRPPSGEPRIEGGKHIMQLDGMGGSRVKCTDQWRMQPSWQPPDEE